MRPDPGNCEPTGGSAGIRRGAVELGAGDVPPAPSCSLNRPIGTGRTLAAISVELAAVKSVARRHGGTVNDLILTTVASALRTLLADRGESVDRLVISVPVSARRRSAAGQLGNQVGVIPMTIPTGGRAGCPAGHRRRNRPDLPKVTAALRGQFASLTGTEPSAGRDGPALPLRVVSRMVNWPECNST